ncbi:MAG: hypothetical protein HPY67_12685 [Syntrophaceae bacterium]|nr:hypothetical protein [Syntrophaceae bacterium]
MIYWHQYAGDPLSLLLYTEWFPSWKVGALILLFSAIPAFLLLRSGERIGAALKNKLALAVAAVAYLGTFIATRFYLDEVFVNLEHAYNLHHHGLFSFSPAKPVAGTVEFLYYLLLAPFAFSHLSLLYADFALGLLIGGLHLVLLDRCLASRDLGLRLGLLLLFAANPSLVKIFSNGFGGGLLSLVFFTSLWCHLEGRRERALWAAAVMPLIRPDAVLYSASVFLVSWAHDRVVPVRQIAAALGALLLYSALCRFFYGVWVPNPIVFKSFRPCLIPLLSLYELWLIGLFFAKPQQALFTLVVAYALFVRNFDEKKIRWHFLVMGGLFVFYTATAYNPVGDGRYYVGFELMLAVFALLYLDRQGVPPVLESRRLFSAGGFRRALGIALCLAVVPGLGVATMLSDQSRSPGEPAPPYTVGGQIVDRLLPDGWRVATTELNAFGYMNDREIVDLWGYTNPAIARSDLFSRLGRIRVNPDILLRERPEVFWYRTYENAKAPDRLRFEEDPERAFHFAANLSRELNQVGDPVAVAGGYDFVILETDRWTTVLFIRADLTREFQRRLEDNGYRIRKERRIDTETLRAWYESRPVTLFRCSGI